MSLNGLDSEAVSAAYQATIAEPAGWFLLNYVSRDEVNVLGSGKGGFSEARETITKYEEESPLFGLVIYKRKKALLKYVPEGTSRLLQVRLAVHLQSVIEKFPHDGLISITTAVELHETVLATSLGTLKSSGSIKSPTGKAARPLTEILEDASETSQKKSGNDNPATLRVEDGVEAPQSQKLVESSEERDLPLRVSGDKPAPDSLAEEDASSLPTKESIDLESTRPRTSFETRPSTSLTRAVTYEADVSWAYKPKVKLGPRPSLEASQQSRVSATFARNTAKLPANLRITSPKPFATDRPQTSKTPSKSFFDDMGRFPIQPFAEGPRPHSRSGSVLTVPAYTEFPETLSPVSPSAPAITPEKQRLMKALQQRKKQQLARKTVEDAAVKESKEPEADGTYESKKDLMANGKAHQPEQDHVSEPPVETHSDLESTLQSSGNKDMEDSGKAAHSNTLQAVDDTEAETEMTENNQDLNGVVADAANSSAKKDSTLSAPEHSTELTENGQNSEISKVDEIAERQREQEENESEMEEPSKVGDQNQERAVPEDSSSPPIASSSEPSNDVHEPQSDHGQPEDSSIQDQDSIIATTATDKPQSGPERSGAAQQATPISEDSNYSLADKSSTQPPNDNPVEDVLSSHNLQREEALATEPLPNPDNKPLASEDKAVLPDEDGTSESRGSINGEDTSAAGTDTTPTDQTHKPASNSVSTTKSQNESEGNADLASPATEMSANSPTADQDHLTVKLAELKHKSVESTKSDDTSQSRTKPPPLDISKHYSSESASLDGDLLEELQSAKLETATPMVVAHSPATPVFPIEVRPSSRRESEGGPQIVRIPSASRAATSSSENAGGSKLANSVTPPARQLKRSESDDLRGFPRDSSPPDRIAVGKTRAFTEVNRAPSHSPSPNRGTESASPSGGRKTSGVGSLISARIKAFEKFGSSSSNHQGASTAVIAPSIVSQRKASLSTPPSSSGVESSTGGGHSSRAYTTPSPSPHGNVITRSFGTRKITSSRGSTSKENAETASLASTVVPEASIKKASPPSAPISKRTSTASTPNETPTDQKQSSYFSKRSRRKSKSNSISSVSSAVVESIRENLTSPSRTSFSSRRSSRHSSDTVRPVDVAALTSGPKSPASESGRSSDGTDTNEGGNGKKGSRRSRLLRRMSSITLSPRRNLAQALGGNGLNDQTIAEAKEPEGRRWQAAQVGDVNVQFPDTLLWKRRHLELDSHGYIVLEPARMDSIGSRTVAVKRYHVSEFCVPYLPDQDREELPHSVILDFMDSSTLQFAAETAAAQAVILQVLLTAHYAFVSRR